MEKEFGKRKANLLKTASVGVKWLQWVKSFTINCYF